jgi:catechol 2,3-dioxygenase-like lactoylglutathione lyase family enzyme
MSLRKCRYLPTPDTVLPVGIDHLGLGVPDVEVAKAYYDEFMPLVGFVREWETGYRPIDWQGTQIFLYPTLEDGGYSRHRVGLQHISFHVPSRAEVHRVHGWAKNRGHDVVHAPRSFPEYHERFYATFFLDMHGFMLEAVTYEGAQASEA